MKLELNVVRMANEDVIATSAYQLSGLKDGTSGNLQFSGPTPDSGTLFHESAGDSTLTWSNLQFGEETQTGIGDYNGYYTWNETEQRYDQENKK